MYIWLRTLQALQLLTPVAVICVNMKQDLETGLQRWAEDTGRYRTTRANRPGGARGAEGCYPAWVTNPCQ